MKVLHVIPSIAKRYGGPSHAILPMVVSLNKLGIEATIATTDADGPNRKLSNKELSGTIPVHLFSRTCSEAWKFSLPMWRWLNQYVKSFDLVHIHALWSFSTAIAAKACRTHQVPYIVRPAGMLSDYSRHRHALKKKLYWHAVEKHTINHALGLHATSPGEVGDIKQVTPDAKVFMIPNGVAQEAFIEDKATHWPVPLPDVVTNNDSPVILFLSRLHPVKGIVDRLLPAIALMHATCRLVIVGGEDSHHPGYRTDIEHKIQQLNLQDRVFVMPRAKANQCWGYYDMADIFVLPSHSENFGIVVAEAMARGCPVVVTPEVQSSPLVEKSEAGLVVEGDSDKLAQALDSLLGNPELRQKMAKSGREYSREYFSWDGIAQQIATMYQTLI